jgi:anti-sigma regulatory factor (Ser/Thr protein kinase)
MTCDQAEAIPAQWRLRTHLEMGAFPSAVSCGRLHARQVVWEWGLGRIADTVEHVVSELLTNAVRASVGTDGQVPGYDEQSGLKWVGLRLSSDGVRVLVEVWDSNPLPPDPRNAYPDDEGGRGLGLVAALCERWGSYQVKEGWGGKVVWAVCSSEGVQQ